MSEERLTPCPNFDTDWLAYWIEQGQPGRTEPEISIQRQTELSHWLAEGPCPFHGRRLTRADVEWLLATHEDKRPPIAKRIVPPREYQRGLDLRGADLSKQDLSSLNLCELRGGVEGEPPFGTPTQREAEAINLRKAKLWRANLPEAKMRFAHLEGADLRYAHLEGASLRGAHLQGADLRYAFFDRTTTLAGIEIDDQTYLADARWGDVNLTAVDWSQMKILGDERMAWGAAKDENTATRIDKYEAAVRAYRQLAVALQIQGINEEAARFVYSAQRLQRTVFHLRNKWLRYLFSWSLWLLAGYGYRPWRSFMAYICTVVLFTVAYFLAPHFYPAAEHLTLVQAAIQSVLSFHGRGLFPTTSITTNEPYGVVSAFEAFIGLVIEATFIATLTQRLFR